MNTENVISKEQIEEWKSQYKKIYQADIDGKIVVFRGLTRREYASVISINLEDTIDTIEAREDAIIETALLHPSFDEIADDINDSAFLSELLASTIMNHSGLKKIEVDQL